MADVVWPAALPGGPRWGWSQQPEENVVRGPSDKARRRFTRAQRVFSVSTVLTGEQFEAFETFWLEGILDGSLPFEWKLPHSGEACDFIAMQPYQVQHIEGATDYPDETGYNVVLQLREVF
ncbi:MAG: hypothetical protein K2X93_06740 [Candidatus Obscuribacterales bacterium]|nr:hypothetical protein [Candidatus Obscuribacterales bacterium]